MGDFQKLSDDVLDAVSGGTNGEMIDLETKLGVTNIKDILTGLKKYGISAELSSEEKNTYTDIVTKKKLTHDEVLKILKKK